MLMNLLVKNRSYRSFTEKNLSMSELENIISATRFCASARNSQSLRYVLISSKEVCEKIFPLIKWAGAIEWNPTENQAPTAYILICSKKNISLSETTLAIDIGISAQTILLQATEMGYGGCIIGAFNKLKVNKILNIPEDYFTSQILIALGEPAETSTIVEGEENSLSYYRDIENQHHFVPKLPTDLLILKKF